MTPELVKKSAESIQPIFSFAAIPMFYCNREHIVVLKSVGAYILYRSPNCGGNIDKITDMRFEQVFLPCNQVIPCIRLIDGMQAFVFAEIPMQEGMSVLVYTDSPMTATYLQNVGDMTYLTECLVFLLKDFEEKKGKKLYVCFSARSLSKNMLQYHQKQDLSCSIEHRASVSATLKKMCIDYQNVIKNSGYLYNLKLLSVEIVQYSFQCPLNVAVSLLCSILFNMMVIVGTDITVQICEIEEKRIKVILEARSLQEQFRTCREDTLFGFLQNDKESPFLLDYMLADAVMSEMDWKIQTEKHSEKFSVILNIPVVEMNFDYVVLENRPYDEIWMQMKYYLKILKNMDKS